MISNKSLDSIVDTYKWMIQMLQAENKELRDRLMARNFEQFKLGEVVDDRPKDNNPEVDFTYPVPGTIIDDLPER